MDSEKKITLTTLENGNPRPVEVNVRHIKKIVELKGYGARLYLLMTEGESQTWVDVTETADEVKSRIIELK